MVVVPTSGWDWVDIFQICVNRDKLCPEYWCCHSDAETKQIVALCYSCCVCLFFLPWKLVVFYCLILGPPLILLMLLGKNNGKTRAESVTMGWKVRLLNLYQCLGLGFARLIDRFIISTSKVTSGNSSLCCFDSLGYLLALLVFLPSRLSTK